MPLYWALLAGGRLAARSAPRSGPARTWRAGISVVIPERAAPGLLRECLLALYASLQRLDEPSQVIVVVNGAPRDGYAALAREFPGVDWDHTAQPLGFSAAIVRGLARARHDWTLLLNNDMTLAPGAIGELARLRGERVFAVAAQILQQSADGRREETGLVDWYIDRSGLHVYHVEPGEEVNPRRSLCASGGASLFATQTLRRYASDSRAFDPFYWEDVEWGVRAWRDGYEVLFCPPAVATHRHRATTSRFFDSGELARIVERNRLLFDARNAASEARPVELMQRVCDLPYASQRELSRPAVARGVLQRRARAHPAPGLLCAPRLEPPGASPLAIAPESYSYRLRCGSEASARPRALVVTPFAVYPPRHGGARRTAALLQSLRIGFDVVLLSDEANLYDCRSFAYFDGLYAVELLQRPDRAGAPARDLAARIATHPHRALRAALAAAIDKYKPSIVQVEHAELVALVDQRSSAARWVLGLHDAVHGDDFRDAAAATSFARLIERYDAVTVCSSEDAALISHRRTVCVPNGTGVPLSAYVPSDAAQMLFVGPFRYQPNFDGIREFLRVAYPAIRAAVPQASVRILGGDDAPARVAADPLFAQPGVEVLAHRDDVPALLRAAALTVNPLVGIRGSALKLIESLSAGRVCVSTEEGARGFGGNGLAALVQVRTVADMAAPIIALLLDPAARREREAPEERALAPFQWPQCAAIQADLWRTLLP